MLKKKSWKFLIDGVKDLIIDFKDVNQINYLTWKPINVIII